MGDSHPIREIQKVGHLGIRADQVVGIRESGDQETLIFTIFDL
jgi:hypothetical protein